MATTNSPIVSDIIIKQHYFEGKLTNKAIAKKTGIKPYALSKLIKEGGWKLKRAELEHEMIELANSDFRKHVALNRIDVARRHLAIAKLIEDDIERRFIKANDKGNPKKGILPGIPVDARDLKELSQALKNVADVSSRATLLSEKLAENNNQALEPVKPMQLVSVNFSTKNVYDDPIVMKKIIEIPDEGKSGQKHSTDEESEPDPF
jgi:hypothetical protein